MHLMVCDMRKLFNFLMQLWMKIDPFCHLGTATITEKMWSSTELYTLPQLSLESDWFLLCQVTSRNLLKNLQ